MLAYVCRPWLATCSSLRSCAVLAVAVDVALMADVVVFDAIVVVAFVAIGMGQQLRKK